MQPNNSTRSQEGSVSAVLSAVRAEAAERTASVLTASVRFPGEDGGRSLAEMAQRDLDAALQLLADRAQYITGASGAAIALRRHGKNDMLCRASAGLNAPELGALLSTEFGLSGESVRTRQPLRCDDAERDARVNRDVCRQMGIASVVVMPVVHDDEVLGVFELFSGKANAFGARDVTAVQRLSEMVETAVRLAYATETLPERLKEQSAAFQAGEAPKDQVLNGQDLKDTFLEEPVLERPSREGRKASPGTVVAQNVLSGKEAREAGAPKTSAAVPASEQKATSSPSAAAQKKLFWSAALSPAADAAKPEPDQSHVPPVLRSLRKCEACGFPVSAGRSLCVECEEKKWRGQLGAGRATAAAPGLPVAMKVGGPGVEARAQDAIAPPGAALKPQPGLPTSVSAAVTKAVPATVTKAEGHAAAAWSATAATQSASLRVPDLGAPVAQENAKEGAERPIASLSDSSVPVGEAKAQNASPEFVLSAGLKPSQSWLAANRYIVAVLVAVAAAIGAFFVLR